MNRDDEENSIACPHGITWANECVKCEIEYADTIFKVMHVLGNGDVEKGRQWLIETLERMD